MRTQGTYYIRGTEGRKDGRTEGRKDGRKDGRTEGRNAENYVPPLFFEKAGDKKVIHKIPKNGFQEQLSLNVGQKNCRMLQGEHSAILSAFIKLPFVIKIFAVFILKWPFYTGFTVFQRGLNGPPSRSKRLLKGCPYQNF